MGMERIKSMNCKAIKLMPVIFLTSVLCIACATTTEQGSTPQAHQEREVIETPIIAPGIGVGAFSAPGLGSGSCFGGCIGVFEEE